MRDEHLYDPPLEIEWREPEDGKAFVTDLPEPPSGDKTDQAFFYRLPSGKVVGYFNRCMHVRIPLDYDDKKFLDSNGFVVCRVHGARYDLETGDAVLGPAYSGLTKVQLSMDGNRMRVTGWKKGNMA
ncbi:MAG: Rieske 2Fe-2S domain-containing protein [Spirochaetia bacterium]|nr:Rieske 2Fe-2S domain-containing protein [Spirochaetia bacterium]